MNNCQQCPSYLPTDSEALRDRFGRPVGGPMCGRFGSVLGSVHSSPQDMEQIGLNVGKDCPAFGQPLPDVPETISPYVGQGHQITSKDDVRSCKACSNCIPVEEVYPTLGWAVPLCAAKGSLILKPVAEAKDCQYSDSSAVSASANGFNLFDFFRPGWKVPNEEAIKAYVGSADFIDPTVYPTDRPVTPAEDAEGIRAWRRVFDPSGSGRYKDLPIFKREHYNMEQQLLIPQTGDENHPELYIDYNNLLYQYAVEGVHLRETAALVGKPGVGKTQFGLWLAWLCQMPFVRVQFQRDMDVEDLLGSKELEDGRTFFDPGVLPENFGEDVVLFCDEPNLGPDAAWQVMRPLADGAARMRIGKQIFPRAKYNFFLMAMNPSWDPRNIGTNELADADGNRLSFLWVADPPEPVERHIIQTYCKTLDDYDIPESTLDAIIAIAQDIRAASDEGTYPGTWETRQQIKVARKSAWYDLATAYKIAALNNLEESVQNIVLTSISTHLEGQVRQRATAPPPPFSRS